MWLTKRIANRLVAWRRRKRYRPIKTGLSVFVPSSANFDFFPALAFQSANRFPGQLRKLIEDLSGASPPAISEHHTSWSRADDADELGIVLNRYGSDKREHGYHRVYASIFEKLGRENDLSILEIGMGTNNPSLVSTMGAAGRPGASLRAFQEYLPAARIYGADVDRDILFNDGRIKTAFVDQTDEGSFSAMAEGLGCDRFHLVIDDGLHSVEANLNTLLFALRSLAEGGWCVIEDIPDRTLAAWEPVRFILSSFGWELRLVRCVSANLAVIRRVSARA